MRAGVKLHLHQPSITSVDSTHSLLESLLMKSTILSVKSALALSRTF